MKKAFVFIIICLVSMNMYSQHIASAGKVNIIYDTDIGNDVDDILGLSMLYNYMKKGQVNLLGITVSKANPYTIPYIRMLNGYYSHPDIPVGYVYNGATVEEGKFLRKTLETEVIKKNNSVPSQNAQVTEAYKLHRKLLASQPDGSVVFVVVGFHTNMARLLQSLPDEYSPLNGVELVKRKVKLLSVMAGDFSKARSEYNVKMDIPSSRILFKSWPGNIVVSGWEVGSTVRYPVSSILHDFGDITKNPVTISYSLYKKMPYENSTWDLLSVLEGAEPGRKYFSYSDKGEVSVSEDGITTFKAGKGKHTLMLAPASDMDIMKIRLSLVSRVTGKGNISDNTDPALFHPEVGMRQFADGINHWSFLGGLALTDYKRYKPSESIYIADNFLKYQNKDGGWLKNIDWLARLHPDTVRGALAKEKHLLSTLDNRNTYSQVEYLSKVYYATGIEKFRLSAERGLEYILNLQNKSGGWRGWDVDAITFNDDVMTGVMNLFQDIIEKKEYYYWISDKKREEINKSLQRAIDVTLDAQIVVNGVKTAWCQQHDHNTLLPVKARKYELPSISPPESAGVVEFLMRLKDPDARTIAAIDAAVKWMDKVKIEGFALKRIPVDIKKHPDLPKGYDLVFVKDPSASPIWARYYEIENNTPFLANRDGIKVYQLKDVDPERRLGYGWYSSGPQSLISVEYPEWKKKLTAKIKTHEN